MKALRLELRMIQNTPEAFQADLPLADIGVAIEPGCKAALRIVGVNHLYVIEPQDCFDFGDGMLQAIGSRDVVAAGSEAVASIEAEPDRQIHALLGKFAHRTQLFEPAAKLRAGADRVLQQDLKVLATEAARGFFDTFDYCA